MFPSSSLLGALSALFILGSIAAMGACAAASRDGADAAETHKPGGDAGGDADTADIDRTGLHQSCPDAGCAEGQECVSAPSPEGTTSTCEIPCEGDAECPEAMRCNVPPALPDTILDVCVDR
jgi:hypothetical protein